jgi:hypothetical protein
LTPAGLQQHLTVLLLLLLQCLHLTLLLPRAQGSQQHHQQHQGLPLLLLVALASQA